MIKISIITINYNDLKGLKKTFGSVINQSDRNFEYIIIDGGSTDGSPEFLEQNSKDIHYWISEKDSGIYNAMNKGIKAATGDYVMFINSGDFLYDTTIVEKIQKAVDGKSDIYYGNLVYSLEGIKTQIWTPPSELSFSYFLSDSLPHPASIIKRELFFTHFLYSEDLRIVSDWEFFIYCICKMNTPYHHLDFTISDFDNSGTSSVKENTAKIEKEKMQVIKKHFPLFVNELQIIEDGHSKRFMQIRTIKKSKFRWLLLKVFLDVLTLGAKPKIKRYVTKL